MKKIKARNVFSFSLTLFSVFVLEEKPQYLLNISLLKQHIEYLPSVCMCINIYLKINLRCSVSLLFYYELLEFYFKVSI